MPEPILTLENAGKRFGDHAVLQDVSLDIERGTSTVIMGESGSGKSVLIKLMNGLLLPDTGHVRLLGVDTAAATPRELRLLRLKVSTLFQSYALFDSMNVEDNIAFPLVEGPGKATARPEIRKRVDELLEMLKLTDARRLMPSELSGGMKKRVSLARALISNPEVVLFDEPTTGLDPVMIEFVDDMLIDVRTKYSITSVIISHDMASAFRLGDTLAMLHEGRITFRGTPDEARACEQPEVKRFIHLATSRLEAPDAAASAAPAGSGGLRWEDLPKPTTETVVEVHDVTKAFGERVVLRGMNFFVPKGEVTTIIGGSGSGKTVMMKHILGLLKPDSGRVEVFGRDLATLNARESVLMRLRFGMLFQGAALFDSMTVLENVAFPLIESPRPEHVSVAKAREMALETLRRLKIDDLAQRTPSEISGGQRKRVGLARAIVASPDLIIYDEPTTGLDPVMTNYVNDMIVEAQQEFGTTALVVSHDMASTFRISQWIVMLYQGEIIAFGPPDAILHHPHPRVQEFIHGKLSTPTP
jgi:phospholipid/cholesterol/gamma-HCH transport system ATP-binding protein